MTSYLRRGNDVALSVLELFAGAGGGILGSKLLGHKTVCAVEFDPYCQAVLLARQADGILEPFPIWDDVRTFDGKPWRGIVDCISGGFPCQDISTAGKGEGITGPRSGLWKEFARIIGEVGPQYVFVENSPALTSRGLGVVLGDLASMGFDAEWCVLGADDCGARHERERIWILAYSKGARTGRRSKKVCEKNGRSNEKLRREFIRSSSTSRDLANSMRERLPFVNENGNRRKTQKAVKAWSKSFRRDATPNKNLWSIEPDLGRVVDGLAHRVDRVRAIGNGQVPFVAFTAWNTLMGRIDGLNLRG